MITYKELETEVVVFLDRMKVGSIKPLLDGRFKYFPKGQTYGGKAYNSIELVKRSIEDE